MALSYLVTDEWKVIIKDGTKKLDEVGAFDSAEGADLWGAAVCEKYNSEEYVGVSYPDELPKA